MCFGLPDATPEGTVKLLRHKRTLYQWQKNNTKLNTCFWLKSGLHCKLSAQIHVNDYEICFYRETCVDIV